MLQNIRLVYGNCVYQLFKCCFKNSELRNLSRKMINPMKDLQNKLDEDFLKAKFEEAQTS